MHHSILEIVDHLQRYQIPSVKAGNILNEGLDLKIAEIPLNNIFLDEEERKVYGIALQAAFFLWNDSLTKAHDILQDPLIYDRNVTGDYWHALVHRREGDYHNSKNWFPPVHPIHEELNNKVREYLQLDSQVHSLQDRELKASLQTLSQQPSWDPSLFVDIVEEGVKEGLGLVTTAILTKIQWIEIELLLNFTCKNVFGCGIFELDPSFK